MFSCGTLSAILGDSPSTHAKTLVLLLVRQEIERVGAPSN